MTPLPSNKAELPKLYRLRDFNGDGFVDMLAYAEPESFDWSPGVWLLYGNAAGSFDEAIEFPLADDDLKGNWAIAAAQLDSDSDTEVVFRRGESAQYLLFQSPQESAEQLVDGMEYVGGDTLDLPAAVIEAGDLDADGLDELVFNTTTGQLIVRWSSRGGIDRHAAYTDADLMGEFAVLPIDDFDADGFNDVLIYIKKSDRFMLLRGSGSDTLAPPVIIPGANAKLGQTGRPMIGQLDANPALDMITPGATADTVVFAYNFATPAFDEHILNVGEDVFMLGLADLDGTGVDDLIVERPGLYTPSPDVSISSGSVLVRDPSPASFVFAAAELDRPGWVTIDGDPGTDLPIPVVHPYDADADGDLDLLWNSYIHILNWTENRYSVSGLERMGVDTVASSPGGIHVATLDVDGDGVEEAIASGTQNARVIDLQTGEWTRIVGSANAFMSLPADLDGDGVPELVVPDQQRADLRVFRLQPDGSFGQRELIPLGPGATQRGIDVADFNNDGLDDVAVVLSSNDAVRILLGSADTLLTPGQVIAVSGQRNAFKPAALDFDQDGVMDLAIGDEDSEKITLHLGLGDGTFEPAHTIPSPSVYWLEAADVDGDGITDLLGCDNQTRIDVSFLNASGMVDEQIVLYAENAIEVLAEDLNGDGLLDITNASGSMLGQTPSPRILLQTKPREFSGLVFPLARYSVGIATTDVNQDGAPEVIYQSNDLGQFRIHYGTPAPCPADLTGDGQITFFDVSAFLQLQPDWDGDGDFDFFDVSAYLQAYAAGCP